MPNKFTERSLRHKFDDIFPTLVRYVGVVLMTYAGFVDKGANPALIPAATGMIFFKTIVGTRELD